MFYYQKKSTVPVEFLSNQKQDCAIMQIFVQFLKSQKIAHTPIYSKIHAKLV